MNDDRLFTVAGQLEECPSPFKTFQIQGNDIRFRVVFEIIQKVGFIELKLVAGGGEFSRFDSVTRHGAKIRPHRHFGK